AACAEWGAPMVYAETLSESGAAFAFRNKKNKALRNFGLVTIWNYILKQQKGDEQGAARLCEDYWEDLPKIGANMTDREVMFPANLKVAHARVISAIKYQEDEALRKKFLKISKNLSALKWEHNGLLIIPAASESELIAEGKILEHCVGGYGHAHCEGKSIFFIRHTQEKDVPYFTLQLNTKTGFVIQNRGQKNCDRTKEVEMFEKEWLSTIVMPWINQKKESKTA
ncbi:MAG: PcfJ domain-containing protein, partial [Oscillospiraceae bacterium]|nr:PcfJ domain-containing protein [Oscillospiraceae bacterium]